MSDKPLVWLSGEIKTPPFTQEARIEAGWMLRRLQRGERLVFPQSRPMPIVGRNCHELRIPSASASWRIVYGLETGAVVILAALRSAPCPHRIASLPSVAGDYVNTNGAWGASMNRKTKQRLEKAGWRVGSAEDFLGLTAEQSAIIDLRLSLSDVVRKARERARLSQQELAERIDSSQSRIAKVEAGGPGVSMDLMIRAALAAGAKRSELARAMLPRRRVAG